MSAVKRLQNRSATGPGRPPGVRRAPIRRWPRGDGDKHDRAEHHPHAARDHHPVFEQRQREADDGGHGHAQQDDPYGHAAGHLFRSKPPVGVEVGKAPHDQRSRHQQESEDTEPRGERMNRNTSVNTVAQKLPRDSVRTARATSPNRTASERPRKGARSWGRRPSTERARRGQCRAPRRCSSSSPGTRTGLRRTASPARRRLHRPMDAVDGEPRQNDRRGQGQERGRLTYPA